MFDVRLFKKYSGKTHFINGNTHVDDDGTRTLLFALMDRTHRGDQAIENAVYLGTLTKEEWQSMTLEQYKHDAYQTYKTMLNLVNSETKQDWYI